MTDAVAAQVDLDALERAYKEAVSTITKRVIVCAGTGCVASGSLRVYERLVAEIERWGLDVEVELKLEEDSIEENATCPGAKFLVSKSGCQGFCQMGPLVTILPENIFYVKVRPEDAPEIVERTLLGGEAIDRLLYVDPRTRKRAVRTSEIQFYAKQKRLLLLCRP